MLYKFNTFVRIALVVFLVVPIPVYAETTTVTETFDDQEINSDITFVYGASDTEVSAATTQSPDCADTSNPGSIGIEDLDCFGNQYFSLNLQ